MPPDTGLQQDLHDAIHANHTAASQRVAGLNPAAVTANIDGWSLLDAATPEMPVFNQAVVVEPHADLTTPERWYGDRSSPFRLVLRDDRDAALIQSALQAGYHTERMEPALFQELGDATPAPASPLTIREVGPGDLHLYGCVGWKRDGLEHIGVAIAERAQQLGFIMLLGLLDGQAVATSMAVLTDELVGIYNVGVEPDYRRRGFGEAITWAAVEAGRRRGATASWVGTTDMGQGVYERMGFRQLFSYNVLVSTDAVRVPTA